MMSAPNKTERERCWAARDVLWKCLDENNDDQSKCKHLRKPYEDNCSNQWVKYFDRRRGYLKFKEKMETEGFQSPEGNKS